MISKGGGLRKIVYPEANRISLHNKGRVKAVIKLFASEMSISHHNNHIV